MSDTVKLTANPVRWIMCRAMMCGGMPVTAWDDDGNLWCAWQCATCGAVKHAHKTDIGSDAGRSALAEDGRT